MTDYKPPIPPPRCEEVTTLLDALQSRLPAMIAAHTESDGDFWCAFAGESDLIEDRASDPADVAYVRQRLDSMLVAHGKNPDTDVPCDG